MMTIEMTAIARVRSPFKEKFGTPRQSGLTPAIRATIEFFPEFCPREAVRELETFSHLWLLFLFDQNLERGWQATVRPPRLGGNRRVGVYASRSPFRPNPVGLSAVRLLAIKQRADTVLLEVEGADLIDNTPIIDIKPYIPYADSIPEALGGFAPEPPEPALAIEFSPPAQRELAAILPQSPDFDEQLCQLLQQDPRPAYQRNNPGREYGLLFAGYNIRWRVSGRMLSVVAIEPEQLAF